MANTQAGIFLIFALDGIIIGILFDFFRILRRSFSTGAFFTALEDILFWILSGAIFLYSVFAYNNGIIRFYMFLGIFCGVLLYILTFSKFFIKTNVLVIQYIKKFLKFIFIPFKFIFNILKTIIFKPIITIFEKLVKIFKKFIIKLSKFWNFTKKVNK